MQLNDKQIQETALDIIAQGITKVALVGDFSPLDHLVFMKINAGLWCFSSRLNSTLSALIPLEVWGFSKEKMPRS